MVEVIFLEHHQLVFAGAQHMEDRHLAIATHLERRGMNLRREEILATLLRRLDEASRELARVDDDLHADADAEIDAPLVSTVDGDNFRTISDRLAQRRLSLAKRWTAAHERDRHVVGLVRPRLRQADARLPMSAFGGIADIAISERDVCF
jgi:hypothetical protein